jgi:hypothetical protein
MVTIGSISPTTAMPGKPANVNILHVELAALSLHQTYDTLSSLITEAQMLNIVVRYQVAFSTPLINKVSRIDMSHHPDRHHPRAALRLPDDHNSQEPTPTSRIRLISD